jgi:FAD/FMN-containing dehydrogenase
MAIPVSLRNDLSGIQLLEDAGTLQPRSRDFFRFSPILKETLENRRAEIVAVPQDKDQLVRVAATFAPHRVPLTARGGGTGRYGQTTV